MSEPVILTLDQALDHIERLERELDQAREGATVAREALAEIRTLWRGHADNITMDTDEDERLKRELGTLLERFVTIADERLASVTDDGLVGPAICYACPTFEGAAHMPGAANHRTVPEGAPMPDLDEFSLSPEDYGALLDQSATLRFYLDEAREALTHIAKHASGEWPLHHGQKCWFGETTGSIARLGLASSTGPEGGADPMEALRYIAEQHGSFCDGTGAHWACGVARKALASIEGSKA